MSKPSSSNVTKRLLGKILVDGEFVTPDHLKTAKKLGTKLILTAAIIALLSMSGMLGGGQEAHAGGPVITSKIQLSARVLPYTNVTVLNQAQELVITNADLKRGYIEMPAATRIKIRCNNPAGYFLAFESMGGTDSVFSSVKVVIGGRETHLQPNGSGWIPQPYIRGDVIQDLTYRFAFLKNTQPGAYNWPFMISVHPI